MNRKKFLKQTFLTSTALLAAPVFAFTQTRLEGESPLPIDKVKEFVRAGHGNIDKVKSMLAELPTLLYATYDWNNGDFETALEGAGHVGNKEIANYLIGLGARTNLFVLTMLGKTALVKEYLTLFPQYMTARGPHGLTLLHHAQKGGQDARELFEFLQSKGLKDLKMAL
jgi:hypothetical protein